MDTSRPTVRLGLGPHLRHVGREGGRQLQQLVTKVASMKLLDIKTGVPGHLARVNLARQRWLWGLGPGRLTAKPPG